MEENLNVELKYINPDTSLPDSAKVCEEYVYLQALITWMPWVISIIVAVANQFIEDLFTYLTKKEHYAYHDTMSASLILKIFVASTFNTSALILIMNIKPINPHANAKIFGYDIFSGDYFDINPDWYANVGTNFITAMISDLAVDLIMTWKGIVWKRLKQLWDVIRWPCGLTEAQREDKNYEFCCKCQNSEKTQNFRCCGVYGKVTKTETVSDYKVNIYFRYGFGSH